jgi:hypothetical protein
MQTKLPLSLPNTSIKELEIFQELSELDSTYINIDTIILPIQATLLETVKILLDSLTEDILLQMPNNSDILSKGKYDVTVAINLRYKNAYKDVLQ